MGKRKEKGFYDIKLTVRADKRFFIKAIAWELYANEISTDLLKVESAATIVTRHAILYGQSGWNGNTDISQTIGSDTADDFNSSWEQAKEFVEANLPELK